MEARPFQFTTRRIAVAMFWLSVCLALWTSGRVFDDGYPLLLGWLALCMAVAELGGFALKYAVGVVVVTALIFVVLPLVYALTWIVPARVAIWVAILAIVLVAHLGIKVKNGPGARRAEQGDRSG